MTSTTTTTERVRTVRAGTATGAVIRCGVSDAMLAELAVSVVFFYDHPLDEERLAAGLAVALDRIPMFGGRLRGGADGLEIVCSDAGVPLVSADAPETLGEALGRMTLAASGYVDHVAAQAVHEGELPLFTVRLSRLADGGTALGCSWHHVLGDVQTFMTLMWAWSAAVAGEELPEVLEIVDREAYLESVLPARDSGRLGFRIPEPAEAELLAKEFAVASRANRTVQVYFTDAEVAGLRAEFEEAAGRRLSVNDVLCAHVVSAVRRLDEDHEGRTLVLPVNVRRHLGLPDGGLGNVLGEIVLSCPADAEPAALAALIRAGVEGFLTEHLSLRTNRDFLAGLGRDRLRECVPLGFDPAAKTFTLSTWSRAGVYELAFDGHRPIAFSPAASVQLPWVSWLVEGFEGRGHLLTISLPVRLAGRLRGEAGQALLHPHRAVDEQLPEIARQMKKLA
ncbi:acyltransferase [Kitasatospora sp. NPDC096147]|uniref:acyltransferase n=1 Tax=Kitasatospora sp. NPDC096147 TaxID=3364093 RepID=UPI00380ADC4E